MTEFTKTQGRYLSFIHAYIDSFGVPPSMAEIAEALDVKSPSVNGMLKTLDKKGLIRRQPGVARSIEILVDPETLPKWNKQVTRTVYERGVQAPHLKTFSMIKQMLAVENELIGDPQIDSLQKSEPTIPKSDICYRLKITLNNSHPSIWRRFETQDISIECLHEMVQTVMGWTNSHLHEFVVGKARFSHPQFFEHSFDDFGSVSYANHTISDWVEMFGKKPKIKYLYDFGDGWEHTIVLEKIFSPDPNEDYPICTSGKNACPPEDIGGVWGYHEFVEAIADPKHESHEHYMEWHGPFEPQEFDCDATTRMMQAALPRLTN